MSLRIGFGYHWPLAASAFLRESTGEQHAASGTRRSREPAYRLHLGLGDLVLWLLILIGILVLAGMLCVGRVLVHRCPDKAHRDIVVRRLLVGGLAAAAVWLVAVALYGVAEYRRSQTVFCAANLRAGVFWALEAYATSHGGELPASWEDLLDHLEPDVLICPSSTDKPLSRMSTKTQKVAEFRRGSHVSYAYLGAGLKWESLTTETVLVRERVPRHGGMGAVLYGDGHVEIRPLGNIAPLDVREGPE